MATKRHVYFRIHLNVFLICKQNSLFTIACRQTTAIASSNVGKQILEVKIRLSSSEIKNIHFCFSQAQVSNKQRKEQQRQEKKKRQEERHRQKFLQSRGSPDQNLPETVTLVPALNTLSI